MTLNEDYEDLVDGLLLTAGRQLALVELMNGQLKKVRSLLNFVEDEFEEAEVDSPYLSETVAILNGLENFSLSQSSLMDRFEKISTDQLLIGVVERLNRLNDKSSYDTSGIDGGFLFRAEVNSISRALLVLLKFFQASGEKQQVTRVSPPVALEGEAGRDCIVIGEKVAEISWQPLVESVSFAKELKKAEELLESFGVLRLHEVGLYLSLDEKSLLLSFPQVSSPDIQGELDTELFAEDLRGDKTLLVVDDEDMIWDVLIEHLQDLGYVVLLAGNGLEALEIYRENPGEIDLVILDVIMPEMNGREALQEIMKVDSAAKVLISSGYVGETEAAELLEMGACAFLKKPYRMKELAQQVKKLTEEG